MKKTDEPIEWDTPEFDAKTTPGHDDDRLPCGCPADYHMSDCPIRTAFEVPAEGSWEEEEGRGFDGYGEDD